MILEVATLNVIAGREDEFEAAFFRAQQIISGMQGYLSHEVKRCIESRNQYLLLVRWETLTDHTEGFRGSPEYQEWRRLLHHFYSPFPEVLHYQETGLSGDSRDRVV